MADHSAALSDRPEFGPGESGREPVRAIVHILRAVAILIGAAVLLWALSDAVLIIFLAILLATLLRGLGQQLARLTRLNVTVAVLLVSLALIVLVGELSWWVGPKFVSEAQQLWGQLSQRFGSIQKMAGGLGLSGGGSGAVSVMPHMVELLASSTLSFLSALLVIVATAVYFAIAPDVYVNGMVHLVPPWYQPRARGIILEMGGTMQGWLLGQLIDMIVVGVLAGIGLYLLQAPLILALAVLAGLLTFVPYFGTLIAGVLGAVVGLAVSLNEALWIVGLFLVCHGIEGYLVSPFVQRRTVHLPPALTLLSMVVLTAFFGILGVLVATPLIAVLMVGVTRVYVEDILGDRDAGAKLTMRSRWYWFTPPELTP
jgi:predicted PurR-regulated permease PerM